MGLKSEGVRGAVTLGTGCIDAVFHCVGTRDEASDMFSMSASGAAKTGAPIRKNHDGMLSSPVYRFFGFSFRLAFFYILISCVKLNWLASSSERTLNC